MNCTPPNDPHWVLFGLRLTEPGGLTGYGVIAFLLAIAVVGAILVPAIERVTR